VENMKCNKQRIRRAEKCRYIGSKIVTKEEITKIVKNA
jgi:hypothetical protein